MPTLYSMALIFCQLANGAYVLKQTYSSDGDSFFQGFDFRDVSLPSSCHSSGEKANVADPKQAAYFRSLGSIAHRADPSNGFVNYLNYSQAVGQGLARYVDNRVYLGVDNRSAVSANSTGRASIRLESKQTFSKGLPVADIAHIPIITPAQAAGKKRPSV